MKQLLAQLENSDVVAYIECDLQLQARMGGYLLFVTAAGGRRYVQIRVAYVGSPASQAALIGHELRHAVEVADMPAIVDDASFDREYAHIGFVNREISVNGIKAYETRNAELTGEQILRELRGGTD